MHAFWNPMPPAEVQRSTHSMCGQLGAWTQACLSPYIFKNIWYLSHARC